MTDVVHLLCPHCLAFNRLPNTRLNQDPHCGKCQHPLTPIHPVALHDGQLSTILAKAQQPLLIDFWASWCGPCQAMAPVFAQVAAQLPQLHFIKVDVDAAPQAAQQFQIRSVPSLVLIDQGQERNRVAGALSKQDLLRWLVQQIPQPH